MIRAISEHLGRACIPLGMGLLLLVPTSAPAANVFEEQGCRFVIDLPGGWDLMPQKNETEYVFKGNGPEMIVVEYLHRDNDVGGLFKKAISSFRRAGAPDAEPDGAIKDMKVNDHPGRWGLYEGEYAGVDKLKLNAALGAVALKDGGVIFVSILNDASGGTPVKVIEKSFRSIRECRQTVTGVTEVKSASGETADSQAAESKHELHALMFPLTLPLVLPSGWASAPLEQNYEKEVVSWSLAEGRTGRIVLAYCFRGAGSSESNVLRAVQDKITTSGILEPKMINSYEIEHEGIKIPIQVYSNTNQGQQVAMAAVTAVKNTRRCRLALTGFSQASARPDLEKDILNMIRSAR